MAQNIIQFTVRNAFAPRGSHDSLARDTYHHAHRTTERVENEPGRQATSRVQANTIGQARERNQNHVLVMMRPVEQRSFFRRGLVILRNAARGIVWKLLRQRQR